MVIGINLLLSDCFVSVRISHTLVLVIGLNRLSVNISAFSTVVSQVKTIL